MTIAEQLQNWNYFRIDVQWLTLNNTIGNFVSFFVCFISGIHKLQMGFILDEFYYIAMPMVHLCL